MRLPILTHIPENSKIQQEAEEKTKKNRSKAITRNLSKRKIFKLADVETSDDEELTEELT